MFYPETKIYSDGSHYIGIPKSNAPPKRARKQAPEERIEIEEEVKDTQESKGGEAEAREIKKAKRVVTKKELFEETYKESLDMANGERREFILRKLSPLFSMPEDAMEYVTLQLAAKKKSLIARRLRFMKKAYLNEFNYFATFTYDDGKHTEDDFKYKLSRCLRNLHDRKGWRYMGVWERSKKGRLHFHGLVYAPEGSMPGELIRVKDYSITDRRVTETVQNTYFNERFGRSDFKEIDKRQKMLGDAVAYILKYLEKTEEKIVYSRDLPMYFISDIEDKDVVARIGAEDRKLLLYDDFTCWDEGECVGKVSAETISKLRSSN